MPFYEYLCEACNHQFELFHGINDTPEVHCEKCKGKVRKVFFPPSVHFKGGGFYATEYGKSTHNNPKKSSSESDSKSAGDKAVASTTAAKDSEKKADPSESKSDSVSSEKKAEAAPPATSSTSASEPKKDG